MVIEWVLKRVKKSKHINKIVLATTKLKEDLKNGVKSKHCKTCWMQEGYGTHSHRKTTLAKGEKLDKIEAIHIRSTNVCNFKCRICSPDLSSAWQAENKKHNLYKQKYFQSSITDVHDNLLDDEEYCKELFTLLKSVRQINEAKTRRTP